MKLRKTKNLLSILFLLEMNSNLILMNSDQVLVTSNDCAQDEQTVEDLSKIFEFSAAVKNFETSIKYNHLYASCYVNVELITENLNFKFQPYILVNFLNFAINQHSEKNMSKLYNLKCDLSNFSVMLDKDRFRLVEHMHKILISFYNKNNNESHCLPFRDHISSKFTLLGANTSTSVVNKSILFISSRTLIYLMIFILIFFIFISISVVYFHFKSKYLRKKFLKKKSHNYSSYLRPFELINLKQTQQVDNDFEFDLNDKKAKKTSLTSGNGAVVVQKQGLEVFEGDTRSEYSITDHERMRFVEDWIRSISVFKFIHVNSNFSSEISYAVKKKAIEI